MGTIGDPEKVGDVDNTPVGQLCEQIADGKLEAAREILRRKPELAFQADKDGMMPLHWAADRGALDLVKVLIAMAVPKGTTGAFMSAQDSNGDTPLHYAVLSDNPEVA